MSLVERSTKHHRSSNGCGVCRYVQLWLIFLDLAKNEWLINILHRRSIRRIRCDETRPSCKQCTETGRSCGGYPPNINRLRSTPTRALAPSQTISQGSLSSSQSHLSAPAQRALLYYRVHTAKHLSGYFHDDFWTTLVLQVGDRDHCVSYTLVALASLHEHFHTEAIERPFLDARKPEDICTKNEGRNGSTWSLPMHHAVSYYVQATRGLHKRLSMGCGGEEIETTLLCCLLLSGFELLRGYHKAALIHLQGSASLLQTWHERQKSKGGGSLWSPRGYFIRERLGALFHRIALQAILYSNAGSGLLPSLSQLVGDGAILAKSTLKNLDDKNENNAPGNPDVRVASPTEARDTIYRLIWQLFLLPEGRRYLPKNGAARKRRTRYRGRDAFIRSLHQWHKALTDFLETHPVGSASSTMLRLFEAAARVIIPTYVSDSDDQMAFDSFSTEFHEMTELAEKLLFHLSQSPYSALPMPPPTDVPHLPSREDNSCFFSLDMGVLHLLYYVVVRCRVKATRYRALALLQRAHARREGVWDSTVTALVAGRVVALEEERARRQGVELEAGGDSNISIPASARVREIWTETDLENRKVMLHYRWEEGVESKDLLSW